MRRNGNRKKPVKKLVKIGKFVDKVVNRNGNSREFAASHCFRPKPRSLVKTRVEERGDARGPSGDWRLALKPRDSGYAQRAAVEGIELVVSPKTSRILRSSAPERGILTVDNAEGTRVPRAPPIRRNGGFNPLALPRSLSRSLLRRSAPPPVVKFTLAYNNVGTRGNARKGQPPPYLIY